MFYVKVDYQSWRDWRFDKCDEFCREPRFLGFQLVRVPTGRFTKNGKPRYKMVPAWELFVTYDYWEEKAERDRQAHREKYPEFYEKLARLNIEMTGGQT